MDKLFYELARGLAFRPEAAVAANQIVELIRNTPTTTETFCDQLKYSGTLSRDGAFEALKPAIARWVHKRMKRLLRKTNSGSYSVIKVSPDTYWNRCSRLSSLCKYVSGRSPGRRSNWLNDMIDIGYLLISIRRALRLQMSYDLVNFMLQRDAVFVPKHDFNGRTPIPADGSAGYRSSIWPL